MARLLSLPSSATTLSLTAQSPNAPATTDGSLSPAAPARIPHQSGGPSAEHVTDASFDLATSGTRPTSAHAGARGAPTALDGPTDLGAELDGLSGYAGLDGPGGAHGGLDGFGGLSGRGAMRRRGGGAGDGLPPDGYAGAGLAGVPGAGLAGTLGTGSAGALGAVGPGGPEVRAELVVRLSAPSAAALAQATAALRRLVASLDAKVTRLDGAQLDGLAATLPLGGGAPGEDAVLAGLVSGRDGLVLGGGRPVSATPARLSAAEPTIGGEGVVIGVNRRGDPVVIRLFRPEPTRAALIGGLRCAQLVVLRALANGARVVVQSARPPAWEPFQRALGPTEPMAVVPPGPLAEPPPASATRPQLLVVDVGPVAGRSVPVPESAWRTVLYVRDDLTTSDADLLARADLALLQPLTPHEAVLAGDALGLGDSREWLTRISADMLGVVVNRQTVRWTQLSTTPLEHQLTGGPAR
jgi:hypothetical protein